MSLSICSLNSGSNGNCYYIGNENEAILVDAGLSCRETEKRMKRSGLLISKVKAIFISHEHSDHINGVELLSKKFQIPVYITPETLRFGRLKIEQHLVSGFNIQQSIFIGDISITAFPKYHDASDPYSFMIECNKIRVGVFTDIGKACKNVVKYFSDCHAAFLESNYDTEMLDKGTYPYHLKKRISGGMGHLSNAEALQLFMEYRPAFMSHLLLSHLSKNNNCPDLVRKLFSQHAGNVKIIIASRYEETPIYYIERHKQQGTGHKEVAAITSPQGRRLPLQTSLFPFQEQETVPVQV